MRAVAGMLEVRGLQDALLVSDPFHMLPLRILARRFGFTPYTSPTRTSPISPNREERWKYIFSESLKAPMAFLFERKLELRPHLCGSSAAVSNFQYSSPATSAMSL